jgi:hypothetical protein
MFQDDCHIIKPTVCPSSPRLAAGPELINTDMAEESVNNVNISGKWNFIKFGCLFRPLKSFQDQTPCIFGTVFLITLIWEN